MDERNYKTDSRIQGGLFITLAEPGFISVLQALLWLRISLVTLRRGVLAQPIKCPCWACSE